jgi:hypothetical protein
MSASHPEFQSVTVYRLKYSTSAQNWQSGSDAQSQDSENWQNQESEHLYLVANISKVGHKTVEKLENLVQ